MAHNKTHKTHVVKRRGHEEQFDSKKLYASVYFACASVRMPQGECELTSDAVTKEVMKKLEKKSEINSHQIAKLAQSQLKMYNPDAAYMYRTHRDIS